MYLLEPRDPYVMPLPGWESLSDYQLCFWYALEIERRCVRYTAIGNTLEMRIVDVTNKELNDWSIFTRMLDKLNLPSTDKVREAHKRISSQKHNLYPKPRDMPSEDDFMAREQEVWNRIGNYEPLLQREIQDRHGDKVR